MRSWPLVISLTDAAVLLAAGVLAGVVGSAGGITSLVSYPALLAVGLGPLPASVANNVALVACLPGSALASGPELAGRGAWVRRRLPVALAGGVTGAVLLVSTSTATFEAIIPFLVAAGSLALLLEPRMTAWRARRQQQASAAALPAWLFVLSLYNGYFGAGSGVMTLTLMLLLATPDLPTANALKNVLIGAGCLASAAVFVLVGPVRWVAVLPLGAGMLVGSSLGPRVARRLPTRLLRALIVLLGLVLAVELLIDPSA